MMSMNTSFPSSRPSEAAGVPAALSAFLRGVERRGAVYAELQCGDAQVGETALSAAMRVFRRQAGDAGMAEWPALFWRVLAAAPPLRQDAPRARWPAGLEAVASAAPLDRAALLLRLVAGLDEAQAAAVLSIEADAYRHGLAAACPRDAQGQPDAAAWRALAEALQQRLRDLPPDRLARLARLREDAIAGTQAARGAVAQRSSTVDGRDARRRRWPWLLAALLACATLGAAWLWGGRDRLGLSQRAVSAAEVDAGDPFAEPEIAVAVLPLQAPAATFDAQAGLLAHPDFELLADTESEGIAQQADLLAWYLVQSPEQEAMPADLSAVAGQDGAR